MDILFACWAFDKRWLFGVKNRCLQLLFTFPLIINLTTLLGMFIEYKFYISNNTKPAFIDELVIVLFLLAFTNLIIIIIIRINCEKKLKSIQIQENYVEIHQFFHQFQIKQILWSWIGAVLFILSVSHVFIEKMFIKRNQEIYPCSVNKYRYYYDLIGLIYVFSIILIFLILKGTFLAFAWGTPAQYLRYKKIIQNPT